MSAWGLIELQKLIEKEHGRQQVLLAASHVRTVDRKLESAAYHYHLATEAFSSVFSESDNSFNIAMITMSKGHIGQSYYDARLAHESNVIALAHVMHSLSDIFSHVISDSLNILNIDEGSLTLKELQRNLPDGSLKDKIVRILSLKSYEYLNAFVNSSKHIMLPDSTYNIDMTGSEKPQHGLSFSEFEYKRRSFPSKYSSIFLDELKSLSVEFVELGREINMHLIYAEKTNKSQK